MSVLLAPSMMNWGFSQISYHREMRELEGIISEYVAKCSARVHIILCQKTYQVLLLFGQKSEAMFDQLPVMSLLGLGTTDSINN